MPGGRFRAFLAVVVPLAAVAAVVVGHRPEPAARRELSEIGVRVVRVETLADRMQFSTVRLVVQAGRPVEFVFANNDAAEAFATQPGAADQQYVPPAAAGRLLLASRLLAPQQSQQLRFAAPAEPGVYP